MDAVKVLQMDQSLFYAAHGQGGNWRDAEWSAVITNDKTGELLVTATDARNDGRGPAMIGFRISRDFMLALRQLAGITAPLPADEARAEAAAELAYWRESVRFALAMLENKSVEGAKANLRALVADEQCYDCRTNGQQIKEVEELAMNVGVVANTALANVRKLFEQVDDLSAKMTEAESWRDAYQRWSCELERKGGSDIVLLRLSELEEIRRQLLDRVSATERNVAVNSNRLAFIERTLEGRTGPEAGL